MALAEGNAARERDTTAGRDWQEREILAAVATHHGPATGDPERGPEDNVAEKVTAFCDPAGRNVAGNDEGRPGRAIPEVAFEHGRRGKGHRCVT